MKEFGFLYLFSDFYWKFFALIFFFLAQLVKTGFYVAIRTFWETILSCKIVSQSFSEFSRNFSEFLWSLPFGVVKTELYESRRKIRGKVLLFEKDAFLSISDNERKTLALFFHFFFDAVVETAFYVSKGTLRGKRFFSGKNVFFNQFGRLRQTFQTCVKHFMAGLSNLRFTCPSKQFEGRSFLRKLCFVNLGPWAKSFRHSV